MFMSIVNFDLGSVFGCMNRIASSALMCIEYAFALRMIVNCYTMQYGNRLFDRLMHSKFRLEAIRSITQRYVDMTAVIVHMIVFMMRANRFIKPVQRVNLKITLAK